METKYTFKKEERISCEKDIEFLFETGDSFKFFPLRIIYTKQYSEAKNAPISILISVPKKRFKHAVDRNRIKRLIREAYRLNKAELSNCLKDKDYKLLVSFLYIGHEIVDYKEIEIIMQKALITLNEKLA